MSSREVIFTFDAEKDAAALEIFSMSHALHSVVFDYYRELEKLGEEDNSPYAAFSQMAKDNLDRILEEHGLDIESF